MKNKTIILTHAKDSLEGLKEKLEIKGFNTIHIPLISIQKNSFELTQFSFDWIVFTSRYGVQYFFDELNLEDFEKVKSANPKFACIGKYTASKLEEYGFEASVISKVAISNELSKLLVNEIDKDNKVLLVLGKLAGDLLSNKLSYVDHLTRIDVYKNIKTDGNYQLLQLIKENNFDRIVFASPSAVKFLREEAEGYFENINSKAVAIGQVTAKELTNYNINNIWIANNERDSLLESIIRSFNK